MRVVVAFETELILPFSPRFSGNFVSGIVGLRVPVFSCLGKQLDLVEGMANATPTLRIFVSAECKKFLDMMKGTVTESSGPILIKVGCTLL